MNGNQRVIFCLLSISVFVCLYSTPPASSRTWDSVFLMIWVSPGGACLSDLDGCYCGYGINCSCWRGTEVILQKMANRAGMRTTWEDAASHPSVPLAGDLGLFIWAMWLDGLPSDCRLIWSQGKRCISYSFSGFTAGALLGSTTQVLIVQQVCVLVAQSRPTLCNPRDCTPQAPMSMGFSRQEYWSGLHFLLQGIFLTRGLKPGVPHCRQILYSLSHQARVKWTGFES